MTKVSSQAYPTNFRQDRFLISLWYDPVVPVETFPQRYQEIADANFTVVMGGFGATTASLTTAQLAASEAAGLKVIAAGAAGINSYNGSNALWGYQLKDEPSANEFPYLANWTKTIAKSHPGKLRFINLLPSCPTWQMNASSYDEYVGTFVDEVKPDVLCMDSYPNFAVPPDGPIGRDSYRSNLATLRKHALRVGNLPFWNFFGVQTVFGGEPDPTEAMIRWQVFTSVAYGAKGILYFCYWGGILETVKPVDSPNATGTLVLNQHYDHAKRTNSHVLAYADHLLTAKSTGVWTVTPPTSSYHHGDLPGTLVPAAGVTPSVDAPAITNLTNTIGPQLPFLVGEFVLADGRVAVMVQNADVAFNAVPRIVFAAASDGKQEGGGGGGGGGGRSPQQYICRVSPHSGQEEPLMTGLVIEAGSACLLVLSPSPCAPPSGSVQVLKNGI